jgi:GxxExxY protein
LSERPVRPLPARALRHGLSREVLQDRACSEAIDAAYAVHEALGGAHEQQTYKNALAAELQARGQKLHRNATFSVVYRKQVVGTFTADLLVDERVLVQVAADPMLTPEAKTDTLRGLSAGGVKVGLVFNFGSPELFFARIL